MRAGLTSGTSLNIDGTNRQILMNAVGPGFVETMGMRLLGGRSIAFSDVEGAPRVGLVNETAVRTLFGGAWPVGRRVGMGRAEIEIIGVVSDTRYRDRRTEIQPVLFDSAFQRPGYGGHHVALRTAAALATLEPEIRRTVASVNRQLPVPDLRTQIAEMDETTGRERVFTQVLSVFGGFALLLASIGLYGITAYSVARRTREIGLRVALGSQPGQVLWLFLRQVGWLAVLGISLGIPLGPGEWALHRRVALRCFSTGRPADWLGRRRHVAGLRRGVSPSGAAGGKAGSAGRAESGLGRIG